MADRTHDVEDDLTGAEPKARRDGSRAETTPGAYQEGHVESIGERPTGSDTDDRSGDAPPRAEGGPDAAGRPDEFISSEVAARTGRPLHDPKTTS